jgi:hypothetical protein
MSRELKIGLTVLLLAGVVVMLWTVSLALAHGGLEHGMGTVVHITDHSVSVKTGDGSVKVVAFDAETHFLKGGSPAGANDIQIGSRVVLHAHNRGDNLHAAEIEIGTAAAVTK